MPSLIEKYGMERAAALAASEEGVEWNELSPQEKEKYYAKVRRAKPKAGGNREDNGTIPAVDANRRLGR